MLRDELAAAIRLALDHAEHPGMCESDESQEPRRSEAVARHVIAHLGLTQETRREVRGSRPGERPGIYRSSGKMQRYVSPWLPVSSTEPT